MQFYTKRREDGVEFKGHGRGVAWDQWVLIVSIIQVSQSLPTCLLVKRAYGIICTNHNG
jgi:hypothetical protein